MKPVEKSLTAFLRFMPNTGCDGKAFLDCAWKLPANERTPVQLFSGTCATSTGCGAEWDMANPEKDINAAHEVFQTSAAELSRIH